MIGKKGLSQVIGTMLMVLITLALIVGLWGPLNDFITGKTESTEACFGIFEKVTIDNEYTCWNSTSNETQVSISRGDIDLDSLLIAVSYETDSVTFRLDNESQIIDGIRNYNGQAEVIVPNKNAGKTYILNRTGKPVKINVAPKIDDVQCDIIDTTSSIAVCM